MLKENFKVAVPEFPDRKTSITAYGAVKNVYDDDTGRSFETANALGINGRRVLPNDSEDVLKLLEEYNIKLQGKMEEI